MGPADLDDVPPFLRLGGDRVAERLHGGDQPPLHADRRGDMHGGGKRIVGRLAHVDVLVRVDRRLAAERRSGELRRAIGNHLVDVHVELRSAARHPDAQGKHVVVPAGHDFVAGLHDELELPVGEAPAGVVGDGRGLLHDRVGLDHLSRHQIPADAEIVERALGLRAPEPVGRDPDLAVAVGFDPEVCHPRPFRRAISPARTTGESLHLGAIRVDDGRPAG